MQKISSILTLVAFVMTNVTFAAGDSAPQLQSGLQVYKNDELGSWLDLTSRLYSLPEKQGNELFLSEIEKNLDSRKEQIEEILQAMQNDFSKLTDYEIGAHYFKWKRESKDFAREGADLRAYVMKLTFEGIKIETHGRAILAIEKFGSAKNYFKELDYKYKNDPKACFYLFLLTGGIAIVTGILFLPMIGEFTTAGVVVTSIVFGGISLAAVLNLYCVIKNYFSGGSITGCFSPKFNIEKDEYFVF